MSCPCYGTRPSETLPSQVARVDVLYIMPLQSAMIELSERPAMKSPGYQAAPRPKGRLRTHRG